MVDKIDILTKSNGKTKKISFNLKQVDDNSVNSFPQFVNIVKEDNDRSNSLHLGKIFSKYFINNYDKAYHRLINCTTRKEVLAVIKSYMKDYKSLIYYTEDEIIYVSILVIIRLYIKNKYNNKDMILNKIKEQPEDLFEAFEQLPESTKENGLYVSIRKIFVDNLLKLFVTKENHQCMDCDRLTNCVKIRDEVKREIDKYPFIEDGYQNIINGKSDTFIVNKCDGFYKKNSNTSKNTISKVKKQEPAYPVVNMSNNINQFSFIDYDKIPVIPKLRYRKLREYMRVFVYRKYKEFFNKLITCDNIQDIKELIKSNITDNNSRIIKELAKNEDLVVDIFTRVVIELYCSVQYGSPNVDIKSIFNDNVKYPNTFILTGMYAYAKYYCFNILKANNITRKNI